MAAPKCRVLTARQWLANLPYIETLALETIPRRLTKILQARPTRLQILYTKSGKASIPVYATRKVIAGDLAVGKFAETGHCPAAGAPPLNPRH
jgi:hypothetical protein